MDLIADYGSVSASFLEIVGKQDQILNAGVGKNLIPKLIKLNLVKKIKISRTRCLYELQQDGFEYLDCVKRYYND